MISILLVTDEERISPPVKKWQEADLVIQRLLIGWFVLKDRHGPTRRHLNNFQFIWLIIKYCFNA